MKTVQFRLVLLLALLFSFSGVTLAQKEKKEKKSVTFIVPMHCDNCKKKVERNIAYEKGVQDLKADLKDNTVVVTFDTSKTDVKKLIAAFKKLGFEAKEKEEEGKTKS